MTDVKKILNKVNLLECKINVKMDQIQMARTRAESCTSQISERVQTSPCGDSLEILISKIYDFERDLNKLIDEQINLKSEIIETIDLMETPEYIEIINRRYLMSESLVSIAHHMNFSYPYVKKMHGWALQEFKKIYEKTKEDTK